MVYGIIFPEDEFTADEMLLTVQENWDKISKSYYYRNHQKPQKTPKEAEEFINDFDDCVYCNGLPAFINYLLDNMFVLAYVDSYQGTFVVGLEAMPSFPWEIL